MNAFSLHNKTALITGAASGLGLAGQLDTNGCRGYRSRAGKS